MHPFVRLLWPLAAASVLYLGTAQAEDKFPSVTDVSQAGPFTTVDNDEGPECRIYRPNRLGEEGRRHPIVLWGNGTGASHMIYGSLLNHWASHGFVVAAAKTLNAGSGEEIIACLDYLEEQASQPDSQYSGSLDLQKVGVSGHSQGAGGAIMAGRDPRVSVTAPMQPYILGLGHETDSHRAQAGSMFLMTGGNDRITPSDKNASVIFDNINTAIFWGELDNVGHFQPLGDGGNYKGPSTAWFRLHLMGDENMAATFQGNECGLCNSSAWTIRTRTPVD